MHDGKPSTKAAARAHKAESPTESLWKWGAGAAAAGAALAGAALVNRSKAKQAERDNPPSGDFVTVDGVRLHYVTRGTGRPIVLLHGNGTTTADWTASGVLDKLAEGYRVIAFDRPGFGYSERPRSRIWTPAAQAALIAEALESLGIEKPLVVGHSFGTLVALALALNHPESAAGLVLLGGYFYPSARADVLLGSQPAIPVIGDVMRYTVSPLIGAALAPRINSKLFNPAPVPKSWTEGFPMEMTLRPWQIRSEAAEAAIMIPAAAALGQRFGEVRLPVTLIAGAGDEVVETAKQSKRLAEELPQSRYVEVEGAGHMVHYTASTRVVDAIKSAAAPSQAG